MEIHNRIMRFRSSGELRAASWALLGAYRHAVYNIGRVHIVEFESAEIANAAARYLKDHLYLPVAERSKL